MPMDPRLFDATPDQLMDAFATAAFFGVKPVTIRQWTRLGYLTPIIRGELGRNKRSLYWLPDLVAYRKLRDGEPEAAAA
jgi:hypothetical protein